MIHVENSAHFSDGWIYIDLINILLHFETNNEFYYEALSALSFTPSMRNCLKHTCPSFS